MVLHVEEDAVPASSKPVLALGLTRDETLEPFSKRMNLSEKEPSALQPLSIALAEMLSG